MSFAHQQLGNFKSNSDDESEEDSEDQKPWDDLGKRLVEARKALDLAKKADEEAANELKIAQEKKSTTAKDYFSKSELVKQLAAEFTSAVAMNDVPSSTPGSSNISTLIVGNPSSSTTTPSNGPSSSKRFRVVPLARRGNPASPGEQEESELPILEGRPGTRSTRKRLQEEELQSELTKTTSNSSKKKKISYGKSIYRGVRQLLTDGLFEARISANGHDIPLGKFENEEVRYSFVSFFTNKN